VFPPRKSASNKDIRNSSYQTAFELSGEFCSAIANSQIKLAQPLVVADIGAAQGLDPRWEKFGEACVQIGFEPDIAECNRLKEMYAAHKSGTNRKFMEPRALWQSAGKRTLNITRDPDATSFYEPNMSYFERLPDPSPQQVVSRIEVDAIPLDSYKLPFDGTIDVIKLDVQAAELEVLRGAERHINDGVLAVVSEILFTPHYVNQPWFGDFDAFMRAHGYQVFDIDLRRWRRRALPSQFDGVRVGGISYGDVLYLKDPVVFEMADNRPVGADQHFCRDDLTRDKLIKLIALAEFFSVPDYSIEIIEFGLRKGTFNSSDADSFIERIKANSIVHWNDRNVMPR
jgi:FkbM family methyltransferase